MLKKPKPHYNSRKQQLRKYHLYQKTTPELVKITSVVFLIMTVRLAIILVRYRSRKLRNPVLDAKEFYGLPV